MANAPKSKNRPRCTVCAHPDRHRIEMARVAGASVEAIGAKFAVHKDAVWRHCKDHMDESARASYLADIPITELAERATAERMSLIDYFALLRSTVIQQMLVAAGVNDGYRTAVLAGRATDILREIGRITGELSSINSLTINNSTAVFTSSPAFVRLEEMLIARLHPYPEALAAVVGGLRELDSDGPADAAEARHRPPLIEAKALGAVA
jgi:hypothetical protein